jgi:hypothetical protein
MAVSQKSFGTEAAHYKSRIVPEVPGESDDFMVVRCEVVMIIGGQ